MNRETNHERPGVYSDYDASAVINASRTGGAAGIAARSAKGTEQVHRLSRYEEAVSAFGETEPITGLVKLLFQNGAAEVYAVPVLSLIHI